MPEEKKVHIFGKIEIFNLPPSSATAEEHFFERFAESSQYCRSYPLNTSLIVPSEDYNELCRLIKNNDDETPWIWRKQEEAKNTLQMNIKHIKPNYSVNPKSKHFKEETIISKITSSNYIKRKLGDQIQHPKTINKTIENSPGFIRGEKYYR